VCSIFTFDISAGRGRLPLAKNAVRKLRTLRHPGVIKVLETVEVRIILHFKFASGNADESYRQKPTYTL
jgi:hypothetical protein